MVMVVHEAIGVQLPVIFLKDCGKDSQKRCAIFTGAKDLRSAISAAGDVIQGAGVFKAKGTGHEVSIARKKVLRQDLTPEAFR
jgi:hypothetical protein